MPCPECGTTTGVCERCEASIAVACRPGSVRELLERWPRAGVAADCGVSPNAPRQWKRRGAIPSRYWRRLLAGAARRGLRLTADDLVRLHDIGPVAEHSDPKTPIAAPGASQAA